MEGPCSLDRDGDADDGAKARELPVQVWPDRVLVDRRLTPPASNDDWRFRVRHAARRSRDERRAGAFAQKGSLEAAGQAHAAGHFPAIFGDRGFGLGVASRWAATIELRRSRPPGLISEGRWRRVSLPFCR